jgi:predicted RNase H-like nuclease (RuvC/YqgF family)
VLFRSLHEHLTEEIAQKEQQIKSLQIEKKLLEYKNSSLLRTVELLSSELERCNRSLADIHQNNVEIRMQALDYKAEIDHCAEKILESITGRIGFIPSTVQKAIDRLRQMKVSKIFSISSSIL